MRDTMAATAEGVRGAFSDVDVRLDAASLKEAQRLCTTYNLDADDLALKWEVFAYNKVRGNHRKIEPVVQPRAPAPKLHHLL